jgi:type 1 fimbria pilin
MKRFLLFSISLFIAFLTACTDPSTPTPPADTKPTISSFTASPSSLPAGGGSVTLQWDVRDATTLSVDNGVGAVTGTSTTVSVTSTTTFTLTATNSSGSTTQSVSVSVASGADTTSPTVLSVDPPDGATGVKSDAIIVIAFSEKMDKIATQAAYQSSDLPSGNVTFTWNDEGTILEIESKNFLEYAEGNDPAIAAKRYAFGITPVAKDIGGNSLAAFSSSFSTLKSISTVLPSVANQDGYIYSDGVIKATQQSLLVGDYNDNTGIRGFLSFDLTSVPDGSEITTATVFVYKGRVFNTPYETLGSVSLARADYRESVSEYERPVSNPRVFDTGSSPTVGWLSGDVTSDVQIDLANRASRGNRTQYRLSFLTTTDSDNLSDFVQYQTAEDASRGFAPYIQINYLVP